MQIEELYELFRFQERRNFFNRISDIHIDSCTDILHNILSNIHNKSIQPNEIINLATLIVQICSSSHLHQEIKEHIDVLHSTLSHAS